MLQLDRKQIEPVPEHSHCYHEVKDSPHHKFFFNRPKVCCKCMATLEEYLNSKKIESITK